MGNLCVASTANPDFEIQIEQASEKYEQPSWYRRAFQKSADNRNELDETAIAKTISKDEFNRVISQKSEKPRRMCCGNDFF